MPSQEGPKGLAQHQSPPKPWRLFPRGWVKVPLNQWDRWCSDLLC